MIRIVPEKKPRQFCGVFLCSLCSGLQASGADSAAGYFAQIFHSRFVASFGLAAIAVLLAPSSPLVPVLAGTSAK